MPWWGWLIAGCVVWISLIASGMYIWAVRKVSRMQDNLFLDEVKAMSMAAPPPPLSDPSDPSRRRRPPR